MLLNDVMGGANGCSYYKRLLLKVHFASRHLVLCSICKFFFTQHLYAGCALWLQKAASHVFRHGSLKQLLLYYLSTEKNS